MNPYQQLEQRLSKVEEAIEQLLRERGLEPLSPPPSETILKLTSAMDEVSAGSLWRPKHNQMITFQFPGGGVQYVIIDVACYNNTYVVSCDGGEEPLYASEYEQEGCKWRVYSNVTFI